MTRVADLDLASNPVHAIMSGTLGSGDYAFTSSARGVKGTPSELVTMDEVLPVAEKNALQLLTSLLRR